ncbi:hypothetical protein LG3211_5283 [Lysobacter gummosus]|nr:hypothetical protein LG3211_5283 [Lysobacter gummosus]
MGGANAPGPDASAMPAVGHLPDPGRSLENAGGNRPRDAGIDCTKPYKLRRFTNE